MRAVAGMAVLLVLMVGLVAGGWEHRLDLQGVEEAIVPGWFKGFGEKEVVMDNAVKDVFTKSQKDTAVRPKKKLIARTKVKKNSITGGNNWLSRNKERVTHGDGGAAMTLQGAPSKLRQKAPVTNPGTKHDKAVGDREAIAGGPVSHMDKVGPGVHGFTASLPSFFAENNPEQGRRGKRAKKYINDVCLTTTSTDILQLCKTLNLARPHAPPASQTQKTVEKPRKNGKNMNIEPVEQLTEKYKRDKIARAQDRYSKASEATWKAQEAFNHLFFQTDSFRRRKAFPSLLDTLRDSVLGLLSPHPRGGRRVLQPSPPPTTQPHRPAPWTPPNPLQRLKDTHRKEHVQGTGKTSFVEGPPGTK